MWMRPSVGQVLLDSVAIQVLTALVHLQCHSLSHASAFGFREMELNCPYTKSIRKVISSERMFLQNFKYIHF